MLTAIIVDDEIHCCRTLETLLKKECPAVNVLASCNSAEEGLRSIHASNPDLVFLDVEMPRMNGFQMLGQLQTIDFHLIFVTSYDAYALKAIRFSAIDYLLKPVERDELKLAVEKVILRMQAPSRAQLDIILEKLKQPVSPANKIALPTMEGLQMVAVESIIHCEAEDNYTTLYLKNKKKVVVSSTLKVIEELLEDHCFIRIHRSFLVNINEIEKYVKTDGGFVVMSDGVQVYVSRNKKEELIRRLLPAKEN
ncbi:MAG TPA: LytTR family DNA-binding domain-containing protein [Puia sp.]|nr:LytTR family DNA-binding domain-containing protein [Puia sp.]